MSFQFDQIIATFWGDEARAFQWIGGNDERFARKSRIVKIKPSQADWDAYRAATAGLESVKAYQFTRWEWCDCTNDLDSLVTVNKPEAFDRREWLETEGEWLERCRALRKETEKSGATPEQPVRYSDLGAEK